MHMFGGPSLPLHRICFVDLVNPTPADRPLLHPHFCVCLQNAHRAALHCAASVHLNLQTDPFFSTQNRVEVPRAGQLRRARLPLEAAVRIWSTLLGRGGATSPSDAGDTCCGGVGGSQVGWSVGRWQRGGLMAWPGFAHRHEGASCLPPVRPQVKNTLPYRIEGSVFTFAVPPGGASTVDSIPDVLAGGLLWGSLTLCACDVYAPPPAPRHANFVGILTLRVAACLLAAGTLSTAGSVVAAHASLSPAALLSPSSSIGMQEPRLQVCGPRLARPVCICRRLRACCCRRASTGRHSAPLALCAPAFCAR